MIDSWNAAKLNERINQVEQKIQANDVIANPTGAATSDLSKISIDGTVYGTSVVKGNPDGDTTADMTKISIDGTVYNTLPDFDVIVIPYSDFVFDDGTKKFQASYTPPTGYDLVAIDPIITNADIGFSVRYTGTSIQLKGVGGTLTDTVEFICSVTIKKTHTP